MGFVGVVDVVPEDPVHVLYVADGVAYLVEAGLEEFLDGGVAVALLLFAAEVDEEGLYVESDFGDGVCE